MNEMEKLFKKKIKGECLENLAKAFDVNLSSDFKAYDGWSATDKYAKLNIVPQINSVKLEAYFHSKQFHSDPYKPTEYRPGVCFDRIIEIPYEKLNEIKNFKLKENKK